jgi:hypothetical protein
MRMKIKIVIPSERPPFFPRPVCGSGGREWRDLLFLLYAFIRVFRQSEAEGYLLFCRSCQQL